MWSLVTGIVMTMIDIIFGDHINKAFWGTMALIGGAIGVGSSLADDTDVQDAQMVYSKRLENYLKSVDNSRVANHYRANEVYNELGVRLDHNYDGKADWFLGKSCSVRSLRTGVVGEWAVGNHAWVVVFGKDRVAFVKDSLPQGLDEEVVKYCSIRH